MKRFIYASKPRHDNCKDCHTESCSHLPHNVSKPRYDNIKHCHTEVKIPYDNAYHCHTRCLNHIYTHCRIHTQTPLFYFEFFQVFWVKTCWFCDFQALIACWLLIKQVLSGYSARFSSFSNPLSRFQELIHAFCTRFLEFLCY